LIWLPVSSVGQISDDFEDGVIDTTLWDSGGCTRGYDPSQPCGIGGWTYSIQENTAADGYLRLRVAGPTSGNTYGAEAWVKSTYDFNDGSDHIINFTWEAVVSDNHYNYYYIQITDGYIPEYGNVHWPFWTPPDPLLVGTVDLLWDRQPSGDTIPGASLVAGLAKASWALEITSDGVARFITVSDTGDNLVIFDEYTLDPSFPWYVRFMVIDATSAGFPGSDSTDLRLYDFSATAPNSITIPSVSVQPCEWCRENDDTNTVRIQPVMTKLSQPINGASIPIEIPPEVDSICGISFDGLLTQDWDYSGYSVNYDSNYIHVYFANTLGYRIPADTTTVFNILFAAPRECTTSYYIHWDTALSVAPMQSLLFVDTNDFDLAAYFDPNRDSTEILGYLPGDVDDDGDVNVADLTALVCYLFQGCPPPCVPNATDLNGSCGGTPNIADLTYLVSYLFQGGNPPKCGCLGSGGAAPKISPCISVYAECDNNLTTIILNSSVALQGVQLELKGTVNTKPVNLLENRIDLFYVNESDRIRIGLLDLKGRAVIQAGSQRVIELPGEFEITEAIVSDMNHQALSATLGTANKAERPTVFALHQNHPNPFNPTTEISFSLPNAADVKLEIFNIMGQQVTTLVNRYLEAGNHSVTWDGSGAASGVYLYRLQVGDMVDTKKMLLLK